ncbi:hypothetical protein [Tropicimonas sp. IMCC34043]|uniref:hypothetical protein n=1 Tax=Tropicimonas sp. IMCC34043 TaxID=2248760 RepID=UPI000E25E444|nr:hypothetical protein [Tropicimonas sp. IMCC34043]
MKPVAQLAEDLSRDLLDTGMGLLALALETQEIIAYRVFGMIGMRPMAVEELSVMVSEKPPAIAASMLAAGMTAAGGQRPDQIMAAAMHPLRSRTRLNVARLGHPSDRTDI